ncbi:MAG: RDD family protein [Fibrobacter sp.]|jgi:uncharacterized RDD family membrane protein YckC|nr:RDD family protein [Fibrobacter sp.]
MKWFYIDESILSGDRRQGPFSLEEMNAFREQNKIGDNTLVWHSGQNGWAAWETVYKEIDAEKRAQHEELERALEDLVKKHPELNFRYAGFLVRGVAFFIDAAIMTLVGSLIFIILQKLDLADAGTLRPLLSEYSQNPFSKELSDKLLGNSGFILFSVCSILAQTFYTLFFTIRYAATPGKMLLRLKIKNGDGSPFTWKNAVVRYFASALTQATLIFYGLGYILAIVDPKKRALHDFFAKTVVVHSTSPEEPLRNS